MGCSGNYNVLPVLFVAITGYQRYRYVVLREKRTITQQNEQWERPTFHSVVFFAEKTKKEGASNDFQSLSLFCGLCVADEIIVCLFLCRPESQLTAYQLQDTLLSKTGCFLSKTGCKGGK